MHVLIALFMCLLTPLVAGAQSYAPTGWADELKLTAPSDRDSDPKIIEVDLIATLADVQIDGKTAHAWTYNGGVPGPLMRTQVGDRLIVHFKNVDR